MRESREKIIAEIMSAKVEATIKEARALEGLPHAGLQGRFREILVADLIAPLLPATCGIFHGTVVDARGERFRTDEYDGKKKTEDDILIVDKECLPPVLYSGNEGIFPMESVLARIEVKSTLTKGNLMDALLGTIQFSELEMELGNSSDSDNSVPMSTMQGIFSLSSDLRLSGKTEYERLMEVFHEKGIDRHSSPIHFLCMADRGTWINGLNEEGDWLHCRSDRRNSEVLFLLAQLLDALPRIRQERKSATLGSYVFCLDSRIERL